MGHKWLIHFQSITIVGTCQSQELSAWLVNSETHSFFKKIILYKMTNFSNNFFPTHKRQPSMLCDINKYLGCDMCITDIVI